MKISDLEKEVDLYSLIAKKHKVKKAGNVYRVDVCPVCNHKDHFTVYPESNSYSSFNDCCQGGSVYKYLQEVERLSEDEAYNELKRLSGNENLKRDSTQQPTKATANKSQSDSDFKELILKYYNNQPEEDNSYFINRGISLNVIDRYSLSVGILPGDSVKRAIIPSWQGKKVVSYNARAIEDNEIKYRKNKGESLYFNCNYFELDSPGDTVFICESEFDALSLETLEYKAISLGGCTNSQKVVNEVKALQERGVIVFTAFDNDEAGDKASMSLNFCRRLNIPKEFKDINEWLVSDKAGLSKSLKLEVVKAKKPNSMLDYLNSNFNSDWKEYQQYEGRKTGYSNLDAVTSLYPGLYVLGGLSSLGKTTFIYQLADQVAENGEHVLYFSLEMSRFELVCKSISRGTATKLGYKKAISSSDIRLNRVSKETERKTVQESLRDYSKRAERVSVIDGNFIATVNSIRSEVEAYSKINSVKPVVIIDYLQIIKTEGNYSDKQKIDNIVTDLKRMSRDINIPVIVVSSLNRSNYLTPVDFESFKESGGIEYTADVVWGLQLECLNEDLFNSSQDIKKKRERISKAKRDNPRQIELVCLKNRHGVNYSCKYFYYPNCDLFEVDAIGDIGEVVEKPVKVF